MGLLVGGLAVFVGGKLDLAVQRLVDACMSFRACCAGPNAGSGRNSLTVDHDNTLHERINSDRPGPVEAAVKLHEMVSRIGDAVHQPDHGSRRCEVCPAGPPASRRPAESSGAAAARRRRYIGGSGGGAGPWPWPMR